MSKRCSAAGIVKAPKKTLAEAIGPRAENLFATRQLACAEAVLTKPAGIEPVKQFRRCANRTGRAAEMAAALVLQHRFELAGRADWIYLRNTDSVMRGRLLRLRGAIAAALPAA